MNSLIYYYNVKCKEMDHLIKKSLNIINLQYFWFTIYKIIFKVRNIVIKLQKHFIGTQIKAFHWTSIDVNLKNSKMYDRHKNAVKNMIFNL